MPRKGETKYIYPDGSWLDTLIRRRVYPGSIYAQTDDNGRREIRKSWTAADREAAAFESSLNTLVLSGGNGNGSGTIYRGRRVG